jgi:hypothetical protein
MSFRKSLIFLSLLAPMVVPALAQDQTPQTPNRDGASVAAANTPSIGNKGSDRAASKHAGPDWLDQRNAGTSAESPG